MAEEDVVEAKLTEEQDVMLKAIVKAFEMRRLLPRRNPMRRRVEALHEEFKMLRKCGCRLCSREKEKAESTAESTAAESAESTAAESPAKRVKLKY